MTNAVSTAQRAAQIIGAILLLVGILGFFNNPVLGIFPVNALHNVIHLVTGGALLWAGFNGHGASVGTFKTFGIIYAIVTILGFVAPDVTRDLLIGGGADGVAGADPASSNLMADNVLHLVLTIAFLALGFGTANKSVRA